MGERSFSTYSTKLLITSHLGNTQFVKFASTHPSHQEKILKLIESGESNEEFFIREEDLGKYHSQATKSLRNMISNPNIAFEEKTQKIYDVSKGIMKEFFESNASQKKFFNLRKKSWKSWSNVWRDTRQGFILSPYYEKC